MSNGAKTKQLIGILVGIIVLAFFFRWVNIYQSLEYAKGLNLYYFVLGSVFVVLNVILRALRFFLLARPTDIDFRRNLYIHFLVLLMGLATPVKTGEGMKIFLLKKSKKMLGFYYIIEKSGDFLMLMIFALSGVFLFSGFLNFYAIALIIAIFGLICLLNIDKILNLIFKKYHFEKNWFIKNLKNVPVQSIIQFSILTVIIWILSIVPFYYYALAIGIKLPILWIIPITGLVVLFSYLSGIPGGLGTMEFGFTYFLVTSFGIEKELAGSFNLIRLLGYYSTAFILFLVGSYLLKKEDVQDLSSYT